MALHLPGYTGNRWSWWNWRHLKKHMSKQTNRPMMTAQVTLRLRIALVRLAQHLEICQWQKMIMKRWTFAVPHFRASSSGSGQPQLQSKGHGNVHDVLRSPGQEDIRRLSQWILNGNIGVGKTIISHPRNHHK